MSSMFEPTKEEIRRLLLPDGDKFTVHLAYSDQEVKQQESFGHFFIGTGNHYGTGKFSAYIGLRK